MLMVFINVLLAAVPSLLLLLWFYKLDKQKPEPAGLIFKLFFWGCVSIIPAIIAELFVGLLKPLFPAMLYLLFDAFVVAALCEEVMKLLTVRIFAFRKGQFDEIMDGIIYTVAGGLGFAFLENILYSMGSGSFVGILLLRGVTAVPLHALCSGIIGFHVGKSKFVPGAGVLPGLLLAILIHGLYDFFIFTGLWYLVILVIPLLVFGYLWLGHLIRTAKRLDREAGRS
jgi:RsiW-degrading membrane proteinase PrsW (M82 family)